MADATQPPPPGSGPGPLGVPGGVDRSYSVDIMVCAVVTACIGSLFVGLRFYTRRVLINVLGLEDWLMLAAQVFSVVMSAGFIHRRPPSLPFSSFCLYTNTMEPQKPPSATAPTGGPSPPTTLRPWPRRDGGPSSSTA